MKRFIKKVFSRSTFVLLTIFLLFFLDALFVAGLFYGLEQLLTYLFPAASPLIQACTIVVLWAIVVVSVLNIISRDMVPEAKLPWLLTVICLNLFGVLIYVVFSFRRPSKRQRKFYQKLREQTDELERGVEEDLTVALGDWAATGRALSVEARACVYAHTDTKFLPTGEAFFERLKEDVRAAKKYIFLEYFIIERGKMWNELLDVLLSKVKEGIEVRILYDDIGCMGKIHAWYAKGLRKKGIKCRKFNPFVPVLTNVHNNRDHRKIAVIDGVIGYTGGINLADEYINAVHPFGEWKDTAIRLEGEGVRALVNMFLRLYCLSANKTEDFSPYFPTEYPKFEDVGYVQPYGDGPRPTYPTHVGENVFLNLINGAKKYVYVTTPYLIIDFRLKEALLRAASRGVDVRIVTPHIPDKKVAFTLTRSNYMPLIKGGVKIYEFTPGFIHAKQMLVDGEVGVVGTINLDYRSLLHHFENAVLMYKTPALKEISADFEELFFRSKMQTEKDAKKRAISRAVCHVMNVFAPLF